MVSQHNKPKTGCKKMYKKQYFNVFSVRVCTKSTEHRDGSGAKKNNVLNLSTNHDFINFVQTHCFAYQSDCSMIEPVEFISFDWNENDKFQSG